MTLVEAPPYTRLFWVEYLLNPQRNDYNVVFDHTIRGKLDIEKLSAALSRFVNDFVLTNSHLAEIDGVLYWEKNAGISKLDVFENTKDQKAFVEKAFDLEKGPLYRFGLFKRAKDRYDFIIVLHQALIDDSSIDAFLSLVSNYYNSGEQAPVSITEQIEKIAALRQDLDRKLDVVRAHKATDFWKKALADLPPENTIPYLKSDATGIHTYSFSLPKNSLDLSIIQKLETTLFSFLSGMFGFMMSRYCSADALSIACPLSLKEHSDFLSGGQMNIFLLPITITKNTTVASLISASEAYMKSDVLDGTNHYSDLPIHEILSDSALSTWNISFAQRSLKNTPLSFHDCEVSMNNRYHPDIKGAELLLEYDEGDEDLAFRIQYDSALFSEAYIAQIANEYCHLLAYAVDVKNSDKKVSEISLLTPSEYQQIAIDRNNTATDYPEDKTICERFEEQVVKTPDHIALVFEEQALTYAQLNAKANQLARYIRTQTEIKPDTLIALCLNRSPEMIIAILAVLKAGGACVPIDPDYPAERISYLLEDTATKLVLTQSHLSKSLQSITDANLIVLDSGSYQDQETSKPPVQSTSTDLAYVIYTSGTTGKPKGVQVENRSVVNTIQFLSGVYKLSGKDHVTQFTSYVFDVSVSELFITITQGATLHLLSKEVRSNPDAISAYLDDHAISYAYLPPVVLEQLPKKKHKKLKTIIYAGEPCNRATAAWWSSKVNLFNIYGPTEATIYSLYKEIKDSEVEQIGRPIDNTKAYILDSHTNLVPPGVPGELHIGGAGLARGYLNRPELTAERFIPNPFANKEDRAKGYTRLYKTGDLVRWLPDGNIEYIGRNDFQVKIRGYRIELGEIESVIARHESIAQACVIARSGDGQDSNKQLIAYCIVNDKHAGSPVASEGELERFVRDWERLHEGLYQHAADEVNTFDISVWNSSFTGEAIPAEAMREWVDATVDRICSFSPGRILEVGCGSGLLLYPLVGQCEFYTGIDFSKNTIDTLQKSFSILSIRNAYVEVGHANQLDTLDLGQQQEPVDTIIINSVVQYFPNQSYLDEVIEQALARLRSGKIILGDIRDYRLLDAFHLAVQVYKAEKAGEPDWTEIKRKAGYHARREQELLVAPEYYIHLKERYPAIKHVEVLPKRGHAGHEMNRFRYDVILHVESDDNTFGDKKLGLDWVLYDTATDIRELLSKKEPVLALKAYPNKRVWADVAVNSLLQASTAIKGSEPANIRKRSEGILELEALYELAAEHGYRLYAHLNLGNEQAEAYYDLVFYVEAQIAHPYFTIDAGQVPAVELCNDPLKSSLEKGYDFNPLRSYLEERLPDYMIPAAFVQLDRFPLTINGKLDRKALPDPEFSNEDAYVAPTTALEKKLCTIWQDVLNLEKVGVSDDFYRIGGHSILAMQIVRWITEQLQARISITDILENRTVASLAMRIDFNKGQTIAHKEQNIDSSQVHHFEELILLHQAASGESLIYNESFVLTLDEKIDFDTFSNAAKHLIETYEILSSNYVLEKEHYRRIINKKPVFCEHIQLDKQEDLKSKIAELDANPYDLAKDALIRFYLIEHGSAQAVFISFYHLILDATSLINIILPEFYRVIAAKGTDDRRKKSRAGKQAIEETIRFSKSLDRYYSDHHDKSMAHWTKELASWEPVGLAKSTGQGSPKGGQLNFTLDADLSKEIYRLSKDLGVSLYSLFFSVFSLLIHRVSGKDKIVIRTNIDERVYLPTYEGIAGCFINNAFINSRQNKGASLAEYIKESHHEVLDLLRYPIKFADLLSVDRELIESISDIHFNIETQETKESPYDQTYIHSYSGYVKNGLYFELDAKQDHIYCCVEYQSDKYDDYFVRSLFESYQYLLTNLKSEIDRDTSRLPILAPSEYKKIVYDWNETHAAYPKDKTIAQLFEEQVLERPDHTAITFKEKQLTYAELNARANQVARYIRSQVAVKADDLIAIYLDRTPDMIIGVLGIIKAGAAYVPIDPEYPEERIRYILADTKTELC